MTCTLIILPHASRDRARVRVWSVKERRCDGLLTRRPAVRHFSQGRNLAPTRKIPRPLSPAPPPCLPSQVQSRAKMFQPSCESFLSVYSKISPNKRQGLCNMAGWEADFGFALEMRPDSGSSGRCTSFRRHERDGVERIRKSRHDFLWREKRE